MGQYISENDVKTRLIGKVQFTDDPNIQNRMQNTLLRRLISEAEGEVEYDLSPRYATPFVTISGAPFRTLQDRPTNDIIRTLCELQSVIRVLETDFGRGTVVDAEKYSKQIMDRYEARLAKLLRKRGDKNDEQTGWFYPPLPNLQLNYFNTESDDGYSGMILETSSGIGAFPLDRVNDPSENFFNADLDGIGRGNRGGDIPNGSGV